MCQLLAGFWGARPWGGVFLVNTIYAYQHMDVLWLLYHITAPPITSWLLFHIMDPPSSKIEVVCFALQREITQVRLRSSLFFYEKK